MATKAKKPISEETASAVKTEPAASDAKAADVKTAASNVPKTRGKRAKKSEEIGASVKKAKASTANQTAEEKTDPVVTEAKPKKTAARKPKAEKTTAAEKKTSTRAKANTAGAARKKPGRKPSALSAEKICDLLKKKIDKSVVDSIDEKIAVDIVVWGVESEPDRRLYVEIKNKTAEIQPYSYDDKDLTVSVSYSDAMDLLNGKLTLRDAAVSGKMTVQVARNDGNILPALKLGSLIK